MSDEHNPESYRFLFGLIGAGLQLTVLVFIVASLLVAPVWAVAGLGIIWIGGALWSWRERRDRSWLSVVVGTVTAVLWIGVLTVTGAR